VPSLPPDVVVVDVRRPLVPAGSRSSCSLATGIERPVVDLWAIVGPDRIDTVSQPKPDAAELATPEEAGQRVLSPTVRHRESGAPVAAVDFRGLTLCRYDVPPTGQ
jgi:hypothetical protein